MRLIGYIARTRNVTIPNKILVLKSEKKKVVGALEL
jgi:hypothetical protein